MFPAIFILAFVLWVTTSLALTECLTTDARTVAGIRSGIWFVIILLTGPIGGGIFLLLHARTPRPTA